MSSRQSTDTITTDRLNLVLMSPAFLRLTVAGAHREAEATLGLKIPRDWHECGSFAARRLHQFTAGETSEPWLPRAIAWRETGEMVGYIGFHTPPRPAYLQELSPQGIEFGYTIFPTYRRRRFAWEASHGLMDWARTNHGITHFVVSVSPQNAASLGLISKLGFRRIGSHIDEEDGPEDIFELVTDPAGIRAS